MTLSDKDRQRMLWLMEDHHSAPKKKQRSPLNDDQKRKALAAQGIRKDGFVRDKRHPDNIRFVVDIGRMHKEHSTEDDKKPDFYVRLRGRSSRGFQHETKITFENAISGLEGVDDQ